MATVQAPRAAARSLEQFVDVETPEQVVFSYTVAGVGSRAAAALIDALICVGVFAALVGVVTYIGSGVTPTKPGDRPESVQWALAIFSLLQFAIIWGYYVLFEALADGQTPGKRRLGLRVVQDGGYSVSFAASAVRNLVRVIDMQPAFVYGVGIFSVAVSKSGKRLGDIVAGTLVVRERSVSDTAPVDVEPAADARAHAPPAALATLLTDDEYELLDRYVQRRGSIDAAQRTQFAAQLAARWRPRAPELEGSDAAALLKLHERERLARQRGTAARSDTGARREQHAIVARGMPRWRRFAATLASAQRTGLAALPEEQVSAFVAEYRALSADLARLRTASRGREPEAIFYLGRLVAGGHNLFYRRRSVPLGAAWRYLALDVPREIRRSWRPVLLASLLLYGPAVLAYAAVIRDPSAVRRVVPASLVARADEGANREAEGSAFLPTGMGSQRGPALAAFLMTHNAQVAYVAFAAGLSAGLGTAAALVSNGVSLGGPLAYYQRLGTLGQITGFIAPHGVFELTAITLGGGAGFLLAAALLLPGTRTRREALVVNSRRAIRLVAGCTVLLLGAGLIEGNISPSALPNEAKYFVSVVTALLLVFYFTRGRGVAPEVREENAYAA